MLQNPNVLQISPEAVQYNFRNELRHDFLPEAHCPYTRHTMSGKVSDTFRQRKPNSQSQSGKAGKGKGKAVASTGVFEEEDSEIERELLVFDLTNRFGPCKGMPEQLTTFMVFHSSKHVQFSSDRRFPSFDWICLYGKAHHNLGHCKLWTAFDSLSVSSAVCSLMNVSVSSQTNTIPVDQFSLPGHSAYAYFSLAVFGLQNTLMMSSGQISGILYMIPAYAILLSCLSIVGQCYCADMRSLSCSIYAVILRRTFFILAILHRLHPTECLSLQRHSVHPAEV